MNITSVWQRWLLLCGASSPRETPSRVAIKEELFSVLMEGARAVVESWKLPPPDEIFARRNGSSLLEYMEKVGEELHLFAAREGMRYEDGRFIESWPARMIESLRFNCAGASMLGSYYLQEYIERTELGGHAFVGVLPDHLVLLFRHKERWKLLDLMNREYFVLRGFEEFSQGGRNYLLSSSKSWIAFAPIRDICGVVLGNVTGATSLLKQSWLTPEDKATIQEYVEHHPNFYSDDDLKVFVELIYNDTIVSTPPRCPEARLSGREVPPF